MAMNGFLSQLQFLGPGWIDLLEIGIVSVLIYRILLVVRGTRAVQMLFGILFLGVVYFIALVVGFRVIQRLLEASFQYGTIAALVVFQPEMRVALTRLGQNRLITLLSPTREARAVDDLVKGVVELSASSIGAIVAVQRETGLRDYASTGRAVEAKLSPDMLRTIFIPGSPMHDGAVIVVGDTITAAGVLLPLTLNPVPDPSLGTRHRAAIGLSEETDAVVIVVSEETSRISVCHRGKIEMNVDAERLRKLLERSLPQHSQAGTGLGNR